MRNYYDSLTKEQQAELKKVIAKHQSVYSALKDAKIKKIGHRDGMLCVTYIMPGGNEEWYHYDVSNQTWY